jgi:hypothetical protein
MSDIVVKLCGDSHSVMRDFREDGEPDDFAVREFVELRRVDEAGQPSELVEIIHPGMFVYGLIDKLEESTYEQCRLRRDCMPVFYVLEFLENVTSQRAARSSAGIGSDSGEAFVLKCEVLQNIKDRTLNSRTANLTDLVISEEPFYIPIDSIVTRMDAIIGTGDATPEFDGPRRVSLLAEADEDFDFATAGRIVELHHSNSILRSPFDDAAENFIIRHEENTFTVPVQSPAQAPIVQAAVNVQVSSLSLAPDDVEKPSS